MQQICINEECENQVNELYPISAFHEDHKEDIINKEDALSFLSERAKKIKQTIQNLQEQLIIIEKAIVNLYNNQVLQEQQKSILKYFMNNPFLFDQNKLEISFHTTTIIQTQNIQLQSFSQLKKFKAKYHQLLNENIWYEELTCLNHNRQVHSLNLQPDVRGSRILCEKDDIQKGMALSRCRKLIEQYCEQEKAFEDMIRMKEQLSRLRVKIDNLTLRMINWLLPIIKKKYEEFKFNSDYFTNNIELKVEENYIHLEKMEHIAEILSTMTKDGEMIYLISQVEIKSFQNLQATINQIEYQLKQEFKLTLGNKINLQVEIIHQNNSEVKGFQLLTPNTIKLIELFEWAKKNNLIKKDHQITDVNVHINFFYYNIKKQDKEYAKKLHQFYEFKNNDLIQFELS